MTFRFLLCAKRCMDRRLSPLHPASTESLWGAGEGWGPCSRETVSAQQGGHLGQAGWGLSFLWVGEGRGKEGHLEPLVCPPGLAFWLPLRLPSWPASVDRGLDVPVRCWDTETVDTPCPGAWAPLISSGQLP